MRIFERLEKRLDELRVIRPEPLMLDRSFFLAVASHLRSAFRIPGHNVRSATAFSQSRLAGGEKS
jgi:hypothetical protein